MKNSPVSTDKVSSKTLGDSIGLLSWVDFNLLNSNEAMSEVMFWQDEKGEDGKRLYPQGVVVRSFKSGIIISKKKVPIQRLNAWWDLLQKENSAEG